MGGFVRYLIETEEMRGLLFFAGAGLLMAWKLFGGALPPGVGELMGAEEDDGHSDSSANRR